MLQVVCRLRNNVHVASLNSGVEASRVALYAKLQNREPQTTRELLRYCAREVAEIIQEMRGTNPALLTGYRILYLDGNCLEATEHRLKVLINTKAGAGLRKSLVFFDPALGLAVDMIPGEDGQTQERSLLAPVLDTMEATDLLIADRNFGVLSFQFGMVSKGGSFVIRQPRSTHCKPVSACEFKCDTESVKIFEETVILPLGPHIRPKISITKSPITI